MISIILFYQIFIRPLLSYGILIFSLLNLIYLTLKRYNLYYKQYVASEAAADNDDDDAKKAEIRDSISVLLYAYIGIFFFITLNDILVLEKWVPFWVEIYAGAILWITLRCDTLMEHQQTFVAFFEKQELFFEENLKPVIKYVSTRMTSGILYVTLFLVESVVEYKVIDKEEAGRMRRALDHTSMMCAKASKSRSSLASARNSRRSIHALR